MTEAELAKMNAIFYPKRIAVIGATGSPDKVGFNLLESVITGGFKGEIYPVHPRLETILGLKVYRSLDDLPAPVDLVIVGLNQFGTVEAVEVCGRLGVSGAVCVAGGFRETGEEGAALEKRLIEISKKYGIKVIGPNTLGFFNTEAGLDTTFFPMRLPAGKVSFVTQSGGIGLNIIAKSAEEGLGINKWIGAGNRSVLEIADYLEYLGEDPGTAVIGVFLEGVEDARRLVRSAGAAARKKPVVLYKVGKSDAINFAAMTHTGSVAGSHRLYKDSLEQFGVYLVNSVAELVASCKALSISPLPRGGRVGMYTYTAGPSIMALDILGQNGVTVPQFREETIAGIKAIIGENPPVVLKNPLDAVGLGFQAETYGRLVEAVLADENVDIVATFGCVHKNWRSPTEELITAGKNSGKPLVACYISTVAGCAADRQALHAAGIPLYISPEEAAWGISAMVHFGTRLGGAADGNN
ncbi:MAG: acetate--CoA ligase family protein [Eubacteriales bacterium]